MPHHFKSNSSQFLTAFSQVAALYSSKLSPTFSQLNLFRNRRTDKRRAFRKEQNSMAHFAKNLDFKSIDFLHFFAKRRKTIEEVIHQKKTRGYRTSKIVKFCRAKPSCYYFAYALMHDVAFVWLWSRDTQQFAVAN